MHATLLRPSMNRIQELEYLWMGEHIFVEYQLLKNMPILLFEFPLNFITNGCTFRRLQGGYVYSCAL